MCSYCGCLDLAVLGRLSAEHDEIVEALGALRRAAATGDPALLATGARALAALLDPHTRGEETGLFAELRRLPEFAEQVASLCAEHDALDAALARIAAGDPSGLDAFGRALRLHIDREEDGLFPAAAIWLPAQALDALGAQPGDPPPRGPRDVGREVHDRRAAG